MSPTKPYQNQSSEMLELPCLSINNTYIFGMNSSKRPAIFDVDVQSVVHA
uniref:Uncharacterized protein n=1 Tax=Magallana gigas TaxID=29159 RepID=K1PP18_MAGGI